MLITDDLQRNVIATNLLTKFPRLFSNSLLFFVAKSTQLKVESCVSGLM